MMANIGSNKQEENVDDDEELLFPQHVSKETGKGIWTKSKKGERYATMKEEYEDDTPNSAQDLERDNESPDYDL